MSFQTKTKTRYQVVSLTEPTQDWLIHYLDYDMPTKRVSEETYNKWRTPSKQMLTELEPYKLQAPLKVYRGLAFDDPDHAMEFLKAKDLKEAPSRWEEHEGSKVEYKDPHISSWTKDPNTAKNFARRFRTGWWAVVELEAQPNDTIVDVTILPEEICKKLTGSKGKGSDDGCSIEKEVILKPGQYQTVLNKLSLDLHNYFEDN